MSNGSLSVSNSIRLCHIIKWAHFDGYGFNLHAEKGKPGQYIGKVDEGSPAEAAGLKEGDRIIEVNGVNIANENHKQVVQRIKLMQDETKLLVVDSEADNYFKSKSILIKSSLPNVVYLKTPVPRSSSGLMNGKEIGDDNSLKSSKSGLSVENEGGDSGGGWTTSLGSSPEPLSDEQAWADADDGVGMVGGGGRGPSPATSDAGGLGLDLNMTAKELRARLAARKKYDPKKDTLDFKKKYDIVQKL